MARKSKRASLPALTPNPGPWSLDWSKADYQGPFAWPQRQTREFCQLAGFLASLNTLPLDEVMSLERSHGGSAVHAIADWDLSKAADARWSEIYRDDNLDADSSQQLEMISLTYCIEHVDSRRVIVAFDSQTRTVYPLWWDQHHEVSGSNGSKRGWQVCASDACHHESDVAHAS